MKCPSCLRHLSSSSYDALDSASAFYTLDNAACTVAPRRIVEILECAWSTCYSYWAFHSWCDLLSTATSILWCPDMAHVVWDMYWKLSPWKQGSYIQINHKLLDVLGIEELPLIHGWNSLGTVWMLFQQSYDSTPRNCSQWTVSNVAFTVR